MGWISWCCTGVPGRTVPVLLAFGKIAAAENKINKIKNKIKG
jgi:hypothetical protein